MEPLDQRRDAQGFLIFATAVVILVAGLGLSGFMGAPWPPRLTVLAVMALALFTALLSGPSFSDRARATGPAALGTVLSLGGLYWYTRDLDSVHSVELLIAPTGALLVAVAFNAALERLKNLSPILAAGLGALVALCTLGAVCVYLP